MESCISLHKFFKRNTFIMLYSTIVQRNEAGLDELYHAGREFAETHVLDAIIDCKFNEKKLQQTLNLVRIYQARLNNESMDLVEFSENFIESYATDHNECFHVSEKLIRRIGTTITGSMKIFRKFCPVVRRVRKEGNIVPVLDYSRLTFSRFHGQFFGVEVYSNLVKTLLHEMASFFYHLVTTLKVCKDMIRKEEEARGDLEHLKQIYENSCNEVLHCVRDVFDTFGDVKLVSDEELEERRKKARSIKEWLPKNYHIHDRKWMRKEAYIYKLASGSEFGLDKEASVLWAHNPKWGRKVCDLIPKLDTLPIPFKYNKKADAEGKKGTYDAREMVYFIKWSGVSRMSDDGKTVIDEARERQFYENYLKKKYTGDYLLPSWQAVCRERKFMYDQKISMQQMANNFAAHILQEEAA